MNSFLLIFEILRFIIMIKLKIIIKKVETNGYQFSIIIFSTYEPLNGNYFKCVLCTIDYIRLLH